MLKLVRVILAVVILAAPLVGEAQQAGKVRRIGLVSLRTTAEGLTIGTPSFNALRAELSKLGYIEGRNFVLDVRIGSNIDAMSLAYRDLVRAGADVLVATTNSGVIAAKRVTSTIPIVMVAGVDPVGNSFISGLARPDGNVTGLTWDPAPETTGRNLEFLKEAVPHLHRVAVLWNPRVPARVQPYWTAAEDAAKRLEVDLQRVGARTADELERAFSTIARSQANGLLLFGPAGAVFALQPERIVNLAAEHRVPTIYPAWLFANAGGLMSYGPDHLWFWRKTASYIDRLFKGAKAADLPVEQPIKFELVINLKTSKTLGILRFNFVMDTGHDQGKSDSKIHDHNSLCEPWRRVKERRSWVSNCRRSSGAPLAKSCFIVVQTNSSGLSSGA